MNFLGMGMPEMGVIMLIAFLVLGPNRSISMARTAGKVIRDLKRTFNDVAAAANLDFREQSSPVRDSSPRESTPRKSLPRDSSPEDQSPAPDTEDREDQEKDQLPEAKNE